MDFNAIKYIFQIPIEWYKKIHNRVFNAYGSNFLTVREGYYGGTEIGIDSDGFADEVKRVVDLSSVVKSVDNIDPDEDGNVQLCAAVLSATQTFTGDNTFSKPILLKDDGQLSANSENLRLNLGTNGITLSNSYGANYQLLDNEPPRLYSQGADNQIATRGYCRLNFAKESHNHGNINNDGQITAVSETTPTDYYIAADSSGNLYLKDLSALVATTDLVKSVNDTFPDENGNIEIEIPDVPKNIVNTVNGQDGDVVLGNIVNSVNSVAPINGDVDLGEIVYSVNNIPAINGNVEISCTSMDEVTAYIDKQGFALTSDLKDYALTSDLENYALTTDLENYALTSELAEYAHTVDGHPAIDGKVDFALRGNKWVTTNSSGNLTTTDLVPIVLSSSNSGYMYANNGQLEFKQEQGQYVTLSTEQTITGKKTIINNDFTIVGQSLIVKDSSQSGEISIQSNGGVLINARMPFIDFATPGTAENDTFIIMTPESGSRLCVKSPHGIDFDAPANQVKLIAQPTDTQTSSLAVATVGYCMTNFGKVKSVNNTYPDANGNVAIPIGSGMVNSVDGIGPTSGTGDVALGAIRFINGIPGTNGNFDGVVTSVNSTAPTNGNVDINAVMTVNSTSPDSSGNVDVGTVRAVDGHSPDEQGALSFGLASGSWVKTDAAGHLTTTNESVISVPTDVTPQTVTVTVVADVSWNGTSIVITKNNLNFTNGILTSITDATGNSIATVPYT